MAKRNKNKCETSRCKNNTDGRKYCPTCRKKQSRERDPYRYFYQTLKDHAKARNIYFDLTLEEFRELAIPVDYMNGRGKHGAALTIDRIQVGQYPGYTRSNVQILTRSENCKKRWVDYNYVTGSCNVYTINVPIADDQPF